METCVTVDLLLMTLWKLRRFFWCFLCWNSTHACVIEVLAEVVLHAGPFIEIINSAFKRLFFMLLLLRALILLMALPPQSGHAFVTVTVNTSFAIQHVCWYFSSSENRLTICFNDHSVHGIFIFIWLETSCFLNSAHFVFNDSISYLNSCHSFTSLEVFWRI